MVSNAHSAFIAPGQRIAVAGVSGAGKSTLCAELSATLSLPYTELDSLHWGPDWTPRKTFEQDLATVTAQPDWVIEYGYWQVRPLIAERADTLIWLDYPVRTQMWRLIRRTVSRRVHRTVLWNGNIEQPLLTVLTDRDHIIRWGWRTRHKLRAHIPQVQAEIPDLHLVRLRSPAQTRQWLASVRQRWAQGPQ